MAEPESASVSAGEKSYKATISRNNDGYNVKLEDYDKNIEEEMARLEKEVAEANEKISQLERSITESSRNPSAVFDISDIKPVSPTLESPRDVSEPSAAAQSGINVSPSPIGQERSNIYSIAKAQKAAQRITQNRKERIPTVKEEDVVMEMGGGKRTRRRGSRRHRRSRGVSRRRRGGRTRRH